MNRFCCVSYEKSDSNDVSCSDYQLFRMVHCNIKEQPNFFVKRKIKKLTEGFCTYDEAKIARELFVPRGKELFRAEFIRAIERFSEIYDISLLNKNVCVCTSLDDLEIERLADLFAMVYVSAPKRECELYNVFFGSDFSGETFDFIVSDMVRNDVCGNYLFNLSETYVSGAVNDIIVSAGDADLLPSGVKNSVLCQYKFPFEITGFVR